MGTCCVTQGAHLSALWWPGGVRGTSTREGIYVHIQMIYSVIQQELIQHCKAIILQFKKKRESHGKQQTEHPLPGSHRICPIPKARGPCNMSPTKSQNCYNSASIIAPPSPPQPRKSIDLSYSSPVLTLHIGHMWSRNFSAWYLKQERTINNWCEIYQRILGFEWTTMTG